MVHDVGVAWINPCYGRTSLVHGLAEHPWSRLRIYKNTTQKATPTTPDCEAVERTYALLSTPLLTPYSSSGRVDHLLFFTI